MIESKGHKITPIDGDLAVSRNAEIGGDADIHGKARVAGSLKVEGFLDAPHIKGAAKGLFSSVEELAKEYPDPRPGWFAIVLDATNKETGILYKAENRGWVATTDEAKPYEFIKDSINVFASKGELADETQRAQGAENILTQRIVNETGRAIEAENEIKKNAVKFSRIGITGYADKLELMAATIDGAEVRYIDIPVATETKAGVVSAEDKKKFVKSITWNNDTDQSNMNDFVVAGVYDIKGEHKRVDDNLPILNIGGGHTFHARLEVLDSSIERTEGEPQSDDKCITQVLSFSNRLGQGEVYIRTGKGSSLDNLTWEKWSALQRNVNVGTITSLDELVDNGIYSGVLTTTGEMFVLVVINNYAVAGNAKSVSQFKYSIPFGGSFAKYETRVGGGNPVSFPYGWEILNKDEINSMITAEIKKVTDGIDPAEIDSIKDIVAWINDHGGEVTAIYNAITAESQRAQAMEQQLQKWMDADKQESQAADAEIKANAMQYNTLGINVYPNKAEIYGRSIDGKPRTFDFPAATTEKAGVMSADDKKKLDNINGEGNITAEDTDVVVENIEEGVVASAIRKTPQVLTDAEKEQARSNIDAQKELTLTVKDNGNIVIGNLQGETKEFMPATPSGDPMHYAYIAAGAEYNDTDEDIVVDTLWKNFVDDAEYKAQWGIDVVTGDVKTLTYNGKTYEYIQNGLEYKIITRVGNKLIWDDTKAVHRKGCYMLNTLGYITNGDMNTIYNVGRFYNSETCQGFGESTKTNYLTNIPSFGLPPVIYKNFNFNQAFNGEKSCVAVMLTSFKYYNVVTVENAIRVTDISFFGQSNRVLRHVVGRITLNTSINAWMNTPLYTIELYKLNTNIKLGANNVQCCVSKKSILHAINNCTPTAARTITLYPPAYDRIINDEDVQEALDTKNKALSSGCSINIVLGT